MTLFSNYNIEIDMFVLYNNSQSNLISSEQKGFFIGNLQRR